MNYFSYRSLYFCFSWSLQVSTGDVMMVLVVMVAMTVVMVVVVLVVMVEIHKPGF